MLELADTDLSRNDGDTLAVPIMTTRRFVGLPWLLSGIPIGVPLIFLPAEARLACFTVFVLLETGHSLSPIVLAWTHVSFRRQVVMAGPWKYIAMPGAVFAVTFAIGIATSLGWTSLVYGGHNAWRVTDWTNPLPVVMWIYWFWNIYHFGMQHFGVLRLVVPGSWRLGGMVACLAVTAFCIAAVPRLMGDQWVGFLLTGAFSVNHWVVDMGLSSWVSKRGWLFIAGVLLAGMVGFLWMVPTPSGVMIRVIPVLICGRLGLGFVHFLYSRWVWKFSDPRVRATIGRDLLAAAGSPTHHLTLKQSLPAWHGE